MAGRPKKVVPASVQAAAIPMKAAEVLQSRAVERDTEEGEMTLRKAAAMTNVLMDLDLTPSQLAKIVIIVKLVRSESGEYKEDDYVDIGGYAGISGYHASLGE